MSLRPIERFADCGPGFNKPVAEAVYSTVMKMDADEAAMFTLMLADAVMDHDLTVHGEMIAKAATAQLEHRTELLKARLARSAIAKARSGGDPSAELVALDEINKNFIGDAFTHASRAIQARKQHRDAANGQFVKETHDIDQSGTKPIPSALAGHAEPPSSLNLTAPQAAQYQQAYAQVAALVSPYRRMGVGSAYMHLIHADGTGQNKIVPVPKEGEKFSESYFDPREHGPVTGLKISVIPPQDAKGAYFSILDSLGFPATGGVVAGATDKGVLNVDSLLRYQAQTAPVTSDEHTPSNRVFRRLQAGSQLIGDTLGPAIPPQAKMALGVATHVGGLGPAANAVVGPTVDRASYRYRGTERRLDPNLALHMEADTRTASSLEHSAADAVRERRHADALHEKTLGQNMASHNERLDLATRALQKAGEDKKAGRITNDQYRQQIRHAEAEMSRARGRLLEANAAAHATHKQAVSDATRKAEQGHKRLSETATLLAQKGYGPQGEWKPSETLKYFKAQLPTPELNELQLQSGVVPPSQGVVLDSNGKVLSQAVGYGDDHYLPFTLRGMRKMRGGSYIRTRTWGGPTAEDIRTALIGGARRLTVVSNNGVFTVDFDETFKGGRRHNDKAHRMITRYEHLLDAVRAGQVSRGGLDSSQIAEMEATATLRHPGNPDAQKAELERLRREATANPKMSVAQKDAAAEEFMRGLASEHGVATPSQLVRQIAERRATGAQYGAINEAREANKWLQRARDEGQEFPDSKFKVVPSLEVLRNKEMDDLSSPSPQVQADKVATALGVRPDLTAHMAAAEKAHREMQRNLRLDGPGYEAALHALKEQFPYYIADTQYHAWDNAVQRNDTGYVRPGSNRPNAARAGLNDAPLTGGKVSADQIRGQARDLKPAASGVAAGAAAGATTGAAVSGGAVSNDDSARLAAERKMLTALLEQTNFGPGAGPGMAGFSLRATAADSTAAGFPEALRKFYGPNVDPDALQVELETNPATMRPKLRAAYQAMDELKAWPDTPEHEAIRRTYLAGGKAPQAVNIRDTGAILTNPNREFAFVHELSPVYVPGTQGVSPDNVRAVYALDDQVKPLVAAELLPVDVSAPDFTDQTKDLKTKLDAEEQRLQMRASAGYAAQDEGARAAHTERVHGLVQALTLNRRYKEATVNAVVADEPGVRANDWGPARNENTLQLNLGLTGDDWAKIGENPEYRDQVRAGIASVMPEGVFEQAARAREAEQAEMRTSRGAVGS